MLEVLDSFEKFIRDNPNFTMYTYSNSQINIDDKEECRPKINLPLGTEITFILQTGFNGFFDDAINLTYPYFYLYRYIKHKKADSSYQYIKIIAYNNTTGEVTIENPFGEAIDLSSIDMEIVVLDSLYINFNGSFTSGGRKYATKEFERIDFILKTKEDSDKRKMRTYIQTIKDWINYNGRFLVIYDETFATELDTGMFSTDGEYVEMLDSASQLVKYLGSLGIEYNMDYTVI